MAPTRILGILLLFAGAAFLYFGLRATDSVTESVTEGLTGKYTNRTTWYIVGGCGAALAGIALTVFGGKPRGG